MSTSRHIAISPCRHSTHPTSALSIDALEADREFLPAAGVFSGDLIQSWIQPKRDEELTPLSLLPHPYEFSLYYDS